MHVPPKNLKKHICLLVILSALPLFMLACRQSPVTLKTSELPLVVINTNGKAIPDEPKLLAHMGIISGGSNTLGDPFNAFDGPIGIEIRGRSSQVFPKKQYGFETWDDTQEDKSVSLLGMPKESDWILYAPYSDKSLIRNALVYDTARKLGGYASRHQFVELTLNDQYEGVYLLLEKVKRDKNRVDISKLKDDISGGYILELQKTPEEADDAQFFTSDFVKRSFFYNYPKANDISEEEKNYISSYIKDFETALYAEDPASQSPNYTEFINTESFIDYILISEVFKNKDYFIGSTFMYKDKNAKLHLGPLWDFNLSLGNVDTSFDELKETGAPEGFLTDVKSSWADQLFKDPEFTNAYNNRYKALRQDLLSTETLLQNIERFNNEISSAQERNFKRWPILGTYIWPNRFIGETHDEEISYLKDWLSQRLEWLDQNIDNRPK